MKSKFNSLCCALICVLFAATSLVACGKQGPAKAGQHAASTTQRVTTHGVQSERFKPLDSARVLCSLTKTDISSSWDMAGKAVAVLNGFDDLRCHAPPKSEDVTIELLSKDLPNGIIKTKDFGDIQVKMEAVRGGMALMLKMKPSDELKLEKFLQGN